MQPFALAPRGGISVENPVGGVLTFKVMSDQSGGALTAIDTVAMPGEGPPLHMHRNEDEFIWVLEGRFRVKLGDDMNEAAPGAFVFIPRGTPHTWQNIGDAPARFFAGTVPASIAFEQFFMRYAQLPVEQRGLEAFARLGVETQALVVLGPPLAQSNPRRFEHDSPEV
jgi:quercetin dioxygenase-like cupin family protein